MFEIDETQRVLSFSADVKAADEVEMWGGGCRFLRIVNAFTGSGAIITSARRTWNFIIPMVEEELIIVEV